jgi:voltage-gated potassium channel
MILGYSIIAIPTGIVSAEMTIKDADIDTNTQSCPECLKEKHVEKAIFCYHCGSTLN